MFTNQGAPWAWYPEFLLGFHYIGTINQVIGYMTEFNLQSYFTPWRSGDWKSQPSSGDLLPSWSYLGTYQESHISITKTLLSLRKFQEFLMLYAREQRSNSSPTEVKKGFQGRWYLSWIFTLAKNTSAWNHQGVKRKCSFKGLYTMSEEREGYKDGWCPCLAVLCRSASIVCKLWRATEGFGF